MARRQRIQFCGATYHVMDRGNRRGRIFEDDRDRRKFLYVVSDAVERYAVECIQYCVMHTHYHLIVNTPRGNIAPFMKAVNQNYTQYANRRHGWTGHVFEGRYKSPLIDDTCYLRTAMAYVARNPVEAGYVKAAELWKWSSYGSALGLRAPEPFLAKGWVEKAFPAATLAESRAWFSEQVISFPGELIYDERDVVFGSEGMRADVREQIARTMYLSEIPQSYRALARPPLNELFSGVAKKDRATTVRRAHVVYGYQLCEIARYLGIHQTTISRMLSKSSNSPG